MSAFEALMNALHEAGEPVRASGGKARTRGICHDGDAPDTVSIQIGRDKNVLIWCHKCQGNTEFLAALGMAEADLYDQPKAKGKPRGKPVKTWAYEGLDGRVVQYVDKFVPKAFLPRLPDGAVKHPPREQRVLLNLKRVRANAEAGRVVVLCEGESDADAVTAAGYVATTMPGGVGMGWQDRYTEMFRGVSEVLITADRDPDETGLMYARKVAASLGRAGIPSRIFLPAVGKDVSDHLAARLDFSDLIPVADASNTEAAATPEPGAEDWPEEVPDEMDERVNSLIAEMLDSSELDDLPSLVPLVQDVLFLDTLTRLYGPSGTLKSFIVLGLAGAVGTGQGWYGKRVRQGLVIYLVAEGASGMSKRKRAWEQYYSQKMTGVRFLPRPVQALDDEWLVLIEACRRLTPALIIVDTQARVSVGVEENSNTEMGRVVDRMEQLRMATKACVLVVHHAGHEQTERGRGASAVKGAMQTELGVTRSGKGLDSKVTLKISKQKDDEELTDHVFTPQQIKLKGEAKEDGSPVTSLVLTLDAPASRPGPTPPEHGTPEWVVQRLDQEGVPWSYGRDRLRTECARLGIEAGTTKLEEVARIRKNRPKNLPSNLPPSNFNYLDESALIDGAGEDIPAGETCPAGPEAGQGQAFSDLPALSSSLRERAGGAGGAVSRRSKDGELGRCRTCRGEMIILSSGQTTHPSPECDQPPQPPAERHDPFYPLGGNP